MLHTLDGIVVAMYAGGMLALGWYYNRRQTNTNEYFIGNGRMNPILIGISLFATLLSTISYLSGPGEIIRNGPALLSGSLSIPVGFFVVGYIFIPLFMKQRVTSAYELLEMKLGLSTRLIGASMFILLRLMWMAVLLNFAANATLVIIGWGPERLFTVTCFIAVVALCYSTLGGLRAVVITDVIQFFLLLGGAVLVLVFVTARTGGFGWFPTGWEPHWKAQPIFSLDPYERLTVVGVVIMQSLWQICTAGGDQTAIQRYMATEDATAARRAYLTNACASFSVVVMLALVGLALLGYFRAFPERLPPGVTVVDYADKLFPYFIASQFPPGLSGLVVSGMFAAAMSSIDSGVNSISAVFITDFVDRFRHERVTAKVHLRWAQAVVVVVGILVISGSMLVEYVPGNLLVVSKRVTDLLVTPLFTLFFFALFVRFATPAGANIGSLAAFATAILVAFWQPLIEANRGLSITLINPSALLAGVTMGCIVSLLTRKKSAR